MDIYLAVVPYREGRFHEAILPDNLPEIAERPVSPMCRTVSPSRRFWDGYLRSLST